jgi:hypothetical protein
MRLPPGASAGDSASTRPPMGRTSSATIASPIPAPLRGRTVFLVEPVEDPLEMRRLNAGAIIFHHDSSHPAGSRLGWLYSTPARLAGHDQIVRDL